MALVASESVRVNVAVTSPLAFCKSQDSEREKGGVREWPDEAVGDT